MKIKMCKDDWYFLKYFGNNYWVGNINISIILVLGAVAFYLIFIRAKEDQPEEIILTADEIS